MTALSDDLADLLPDDLQPTAKKGATPVGRTPVQAKAVAARAAKQAAEAQLRTEAARLAQIVNLTIAGYSLQDIALATGGSVDEVEQMLTADTARYIRTQPALRIFVRNWVSERYMKMIEADWDAASDPDAKDKLEHQDRVMRMLNNVAKLHGAEAPTQAEVKVDAAPEMVDALVAKIAASQGMGYDTSIFDTVPGQVVHDASEAASRATQVSGNQLEAPQEGDPPDGF